LATLSATSALRRRAPAAEHERRGEGGGDLSRHGHRVAGAEGHDHAELVAADAAGLVGLERQTPQAARRLAEQHVALGVAEGVVDLLEAIDVDQEGADVLAGVGGVGDGVMEELEEAVAVAQTRQGIAARGVRRRRRHDHDADPALTEGVDPRVEAAAVAREQVAHRHIEAEGRRTTDALEEPLVGGDHAEAPGGLVDLGRCRLARGAARVGPVEDDAGIEGPEEIEVW
jgi:hypothetical protein